MKSLRKKYIESKFASNYSDALQNLFTQLKQQNPHISNTDLVAYKEAFTERAKGIESFALFDHELRKNRVIIDFVLGILPAAGTLTTTGILAAIGLMSVVAPYASLALLGVVGMMLTYDSYQLSRLTKENRDALNLVALDLVTNAPDSYLAYHRNLADSTNRTVDKILKRRTNNIKPSPDKPTTHSKHTHQRHSSQRSIATPIGEEPTSSRRLRA